jgi:hypothetical protein
MSRVYFIDLDGIIVKQITSEGTIVLMPGALRMLQDIRASGGRIYFFSCWLFTEGNINFLKSLVPFEGFIHKPLADEYVYIDDRLRVDLCRNTTL